MSNIDTFTLSPIMTHGYQGFSTNIYYKTNTAMIQVLGREFDVIEVTLEYIILGE